MWKFADFLPLIENMPTTHPMGAHETSWEDGHYGHPGPCTSLIHACHWLNTVMYSDNTVFLCVLIGFSCRKGEIIDINKTCQNYY
jgi:hypothetical protein